MPQVYAQVAAAQAQLTQAMGQEMRYSYVLNDLSLTIPSDVWLTNADRRPSPSTRQARVDRRLG